MLPPEAHYVGQQRVQAAQQVPGQGGVGKGRGFEGVMRAGRRRRAAGSSVANGLPMEAHSLPLEAQGCWVTCSELTVRAPV